MHTILTVGIVIFTGFMFGEIVSKVHLPRVTGYILAGVLLNPGLLHFVPPTFVHSTETVINIALAFITFSVGGSLCYSRIRDLGKSILWITAFEAELAFLAILGGFILILPLFVPGTAGTSWSVGILPVALLIGALGTPTDPAATLAVVHEYGAKGKVTSTVMGVAALDDAAGIINYSVAIALAQVLIIGRGFSLDSSVMVPLVSIGGAVGLGIVFGFAFNLLTYLLPGEGEGVLIVIVVAFVTLCFGLSQYLGLDQLLATMAMGMVVTNLNPKRQAIFAMLERYTEQLIFVVFFTLSGMNLNFSSLISYLPLIALFVLFRALGKFSGVLLGAGIARASTSVRKYAFGGLIPQGGIVVGLALLIKQNPAFQQVTDLIVSVVVGATVVHEIIGPLCSKVALKKAGEIGKGTSRRDASSV